MFFVYRGDLSSGLYIDRLSRLTGAEIVAAFPTRKQAVDYALAIKDFGSVVVERSFSMRPGDDNNLISALEWEEGCCCDPPPEPSGDVSRQEFTELTDRVTDTESVNAEQDDKLETLDTYAKNVQINVTSLDARIDKLEQTSSTKDLNAMEGIITDSTIEEFLTTLEAAGVSKGDILVGGVAFEGLPEYVGNAELTMTMVEDDVFQMRLTSTNVPPFVWLATGYFPNDKINWIPVASCAEVSGVRSGAVRNGIQVHCVSTGSIYSYFTGQVVVSDSFTIPAGESFVIADEDDFPELSLYQGVSLIETGRLFKFVDGNPGHFINEPVLVGVGNVIEIGNMTGEPIVIEPNMMFTFNKMLVLGSANG